MAQRGDRPGRSRIAFYTQSGETDLVTIVTGPHEDADLVLYTIYPGAAAPPEEWEMALRPELYSHEDWDFWEHHALSPDAWPADEQLEFLSNLFDENDAPRFEGDLFRLQGGRFGAEQAASMAEHIRSGKSWMESFWAIGFR